MASVIKVMCFVSLSDVTVIQIQKLNIDATSL